MASITTANQNRAADAVCARANNGSLRLYGGTPPASANAALSSNTLLATLALAATAFGAAVNGVATAAAITATTGVASLTATFCRVLESDGSTVVFQGTVGLSGSGADLIVSSTSVYNGGAVSVSSLTYTQAPGS